MFYKMFCFNGVMFDFIRQPHMRNIIEYMLQANQDADDEVALESCEFWYPHTSLLFVWIFLVEIFIGCVMVAYRYEIWCKG